jgi:hypothetical protein
MSPKYASMLLLVAIIFISLFLSGFPFLVSNHSASRFEGMENPAKKNNDLPATAVAPLNSDAQSSLFSSASYSTSGQSSAMLLAASQQALQASADQTTALGVSSVGGSATVNLKTI